MKLQSYSTFRQRIHQLADKRGFPLRVMFELTYRCNFFCRHCYVPLSYREKSKKEELKTKEIFSLLNQLKDIGCFYLGFTGGEPFIREDIMEILWYAKRRGFELIIYTNGSLIDKNIAEELSRIRPNKVDITIPAMSKEAFERITGVFGSRDKIFGAIDLLHKNGINLGFKSCVLKENESEIREIQDFTASLGALHRLDTMLLPRLDGSKEPYRYRGQKTEDRGQRTEVRSQKSEDRGQTCKRETVDCGPWTVDLFKCGSGRSQAAITPSGELKMCVMIDYPKYRILETESGRTEELKNQRTEEQKNRRTNLKDAWKKMKELIASIKPDEDYKCDKCELRPYCKWCPARGWLENRSFISCEPESRRWAEIRSQKTEDRGQKTEIRNY